MSGKLVNWGIIGLGRIAKKFASDLKLIPNARLYAVASRSMDRAEDFAKEFEATHAFGSYEDLVNDSNVEVIYIATRHPFHYETTLMCLKKGIPVLCEKPFAMNLRQVTEMVNLAKQKQVFLMEALWSRFVPSMLQCKQLIEEGAIGDLLSINADFGFRAAFDPTSRLFDPKLGGGALLDIGIYPVYLPLMLLGKPSRIEAVARIGKTGVDEEEALIFKYRKGQIVTLHASLNANLPTEAYIYGTKGSIKLASPWYKPTNLTLTDLNGEVQQFNLIKEGFGYQYEAQHVMQCLAEGRKESPLMTHSFSLLLMQTLDNIRRRIGLSYEWDFQS